MSVHRHRLDQAKAAGLLAGDKTVRVGIRTTEALLEAAKRQTGMSSTAELVETALATMAMPDPVSRYMIDDLGVLGPDHTFDI